MNIIEGIYKELVSFTYIFSKNEFEIEFHRIGILEKQVAENRLYINSRMKKKITSYLDYLKKIASDFRHKDFKIEEDLLSEIEKEFNK